MPKTRVGPVEYKAELLSALRSQSAAAEYLRASLEDGDPQVFLLALRDVAESRGGIGVLARETKLNRENLYRMMSPSGNPSLASLAAVLSAFGLRLSVGTMRMDRGKRKAS